MINLNNIKKTYGDRVVLDIPELTFEDSVRYAVIGTNGSGKSTLLKLLACTLPPDSGEISITQEMEIGRGYMPQHPYIFGFSVLKNVEIAMEKKENTKNDAISALKMVGMDSFIKARGRSLSGGEAQRVSIAQMIARPRKLLLLDEPTSSTDIAGNDLVESAILNYQANTGCTLIFATHSPAQAMRLSEKVIMLADGQVIENGNTEDVLKNPQSEQAYIFLQHWKAYL